MKFKKIDEQLLLKAIKKLEELPETVRKIHDLKKAYVGKSTGASVSEILIEFPKQKIIRYLSVKKHVYH